MCYTANMAANGGGGGVPGNLRNSIRDNQYQASARPARPAPVPAPPPRPSDALVMEQMARNGMPSLPPNLAVNRYAGVQGTGPSPEMDPVVAPAPAAAPMPLVPSPQTTPPPGGSAPSGAAPAAPGAAPVPLPPPDPRRALRRGQVMLPDGRVGVDMGGGLALPLDPREGESPSRMIAFR